jgi:hypothetical protein
MFSPQVHRNAAAASVRDNVTLLKMTNAFIGKAAAPSDAELAAELGSAQAWWTKLREAVGLRGEWHSYSKKAGWSMRLKRGERNIVYLVPGRGEFDVSMVFGERAVAAARERGMEKMFDGAKKYVEGTAVRFRVKGPRDIATVKKLVEIKLEF